MDANSSVRIPVKYQSKLKTGENEISISFKVLNALTAPNTPLVIEQKVIAFSWKVPDLIKTGENNWKIEFEDVSDKIAYYYTINAENPTEKSPGINESFNAKDSVNLRLVAYKDHKRVGDYYKGTFMLHQGIGQKAILAKNPSKKYFGFGAKSLTDGLTGSNTHNDGNWIGFEQNNLEAIVEFDKPLNIKSVETNFFENTFYWIFLPKSIDIYTSTDGINFKNLWKKEFS